MSGRLVRQVRPLALMLCADRVPIESTHARNCPLGQGCGERLVVFGGGRGRALVLPPEILEAARRQLSIAHRVLDVPVPEVGL